MSVRVNRHRCTDLGSNELETGKLTPCLVLDDLGDLGVSLGEGSVETLVLFESVGAPPSSTALTKSEGIGMEEDILIA